MFEKFEGGPKYVQHIEGKKTRCGGWLCQVSMVVTRSHIKALKHDM
jgi:hypothetical protein